MNAQWLAITHICASYVSHHNYLFFVGASGRYRVMRAA